MPAETELFLDDHLIEMTLGVTRRMHPARKCRANPVMKAEHWWEGDCIMPLATLYDPDEKLFRMWYRTGPVHHTDQAIDGHVSLTAYAVSTDGLHWERPEMGVLELAGRRDHSVVLLSEGQDSREYFGQQGKKAFILSVVPHPHPKDESEKYVCMFFDMKKRGAYLGYSADGLVWQREPEPFWRTPVDAAAWGDDTIKSLIYDRLKHKWVMYRRVNPQESERLVAQPGDENWEIPDGTMRIMGYADSEDLQTWGNYRVIMIPDADDPADVEFYGLTCYNYEQVYVGYLWVYHSAADRECIDIQLVTSRNGTDFTRCCRREVFLPSGGRNYYDHTITVGYQAEPIILDDEVYLYYQACNYDHGHNDWLQPYSQTTAGLATFNRDRFVSLQTGMPGRCQMVTKPLTVRHPHLTLNAATWSEGSIRVEVLTRSWEPLPGFTKGEACAIQGNALNHRASWQSRPNLGELVGREVRLSFHMDRARLHAMAFDADERPLRALPDLQPHELQDSPAKMEV